MKTIGYDVRFELEGDVLEHGKIKHKSAFQVWHFESYQNVLQQRRERRRAARRKRLQHGRWRG